MCPLNVSASAGTIYESESNNIIDTADTTYDDYDNFGTISSTSDVDWWKYTATYTGFANIWLGNIPSGCNYDLYVYSSNGTYLGCSAKPSGTQEMVRCRVISGNTYYAKVISSVGYSGSQYKFRIKNNTIGYARLFLYKDNTKVDSTGIGINSMSYIWGMGYDGQYYTNNLAQPVYDTFPSSRIFLISNHADPEKFMCDDSPTNVTYLYAQTQIGMTNADRSIGSYADGALSEVRLAIFLGCNTGDKIGAQKNLVDMALEKGATCALGWEQKIKQPHLIDWATEFFKSSYLSQKNIANAATAADDAVRKEYGDSYQNLKQRYFGSCFANETVM